MNRREALYAMSTVGAASVVSAAGAARAQESQTQESQTYVLVHGAWHGGWCWARVADRLRAAGHRVFTPTLTGLGDRAHLLAPNVGLATFIEDVASTIEMEDLSDVALIGHSFGGAVIGRVAEPEPHPLLRLL